MAGDVSVGLGVGQPGFQHATMQHRNTDSAAQARRHGLILAGISAATFLGPFTQTVYAPSLADVGTGFGVNTLLVNLTISVYSVIFALAGFVWGPVADSRGRRVTLLAGLLLFVAGSVLCFLAPSYTWFLIGRVFQASGVSCSSAVAPAVIGDVYKATRRAHAMSIYQLVVFMGPVCGPVVGGFVATHLYWQWAFAVLVAAGVATLAFNYALLPETLREVAGKPGWEWARVRAVAGNRMGRAVFGVGFSQFYGYYVFLVFVPALVAVFGLSTAATGLMFVPLTAGILAGIAVARRWFLHWPPGRLIASTAWIVTAIVLLLALLLAVDGLSLPVLGLLLLAYGAMLGASVPSQSTLLVTIFTDDRATAMGMYNFSKFIGAAAGPLLGALIADAFGLAALMASLGLFLLLAAGMAQSGLRAS